MNGDKLRILFLLTQDLESPLGIGRIWPIAKELAKIGHRVRIVALHSRWKELKERKSIKDGVVIEYVGPMHVRKIGDQKLYYSTFGLIRVTLYSIWALSRAALSEQVDIIHVCKPQPMNSIAGLITKWFRGGILCVDCDDYEAASNRFGAGWQQKVVAFFERHVPRHSQVVTTHTQFMWDKLVSWGCPPERINFLPNGVDEERFASPNQEVVEHQRKILGLEGQQVVGYVGTLSLVNHPVNLLIEAFGMLVNKMPGARLLLVGGGDDFNTLKELSDHSGIGQMVIFVGRVAPAEVPVYYALVDVTVDPVYDDDIARGRLPLKMFESWFMGVPFVTAAVGERVKLAGNPPACILVEPAGDAMALADAIQRILVSPELATKFSQLGQERVKNYGWNVIVVDLEGVYRKALGERDERGA